MYAYKGYFYIAYTRVKYIVYSLYRLLYNYIIIYI